MRESLFAIRSSASDPQLIGVMSVVTLSSHHWIVCTIRHILQLAFSEAVFALTAAPHDMHGQAPLATDTYKQDALALGMGPNLVHAGVEHH